MTSLEVKDIVIRAVKTFCQAFVTFLVASGFDFAHIQNWSSVEKILVSAAISGATVVWNTILIPLVFKPTLKLLGYKTK